MARRLLVKPGITGLWQVSGRSELSWDESVRIDVRYVENWTLRLDLMILWKTAGAVLLAGQGRTDPDDDEDAPAPSPSSRPGAVSGCRHARRQGAPAG